MGRAGEIHIELAVNFASGKRMAILAQWPRDACAARDLYVQMVCYCKDNLTDGVVPAGLVGRLGWPDTAKNSERRANMLDVVGLIAKTDTGDWFVLAYLKRNKSRAEVHQLSAERAELGRLGGFASGQSRRSPAKQTASMNGSKPLRSNEANSADLLEAKFPVGLNSESESETETIKHPVETHVHNDALRTGEPVSIAMPMTKTSATALAHLIRVLRPDWDFPGVMATLGKIGGDLGPAILVAVQCAMDPSAQTPAAMLNNRTYQLDWNPGGTKPLPKQPPVSAVLSTLEPHPEPDVSHRGYLAARQAFEAARAAR